MTRSTQPADGGHAYETTPLLAAGDDHDLSITDPGISEVTLNEQQPGNSHGSHTGDGDDDKPLPVRQIIVLCYARWVEPVAFFCIFPYMPQMCKENGNLAYADVGFYSGLIESLFSLTQMVVMIWWGKAADRFGRKPVLVSSLVGVTFATALFGLAKTIWQMILFRCLAGVFAGTIVTIRAMISEHSTSKTQARAFSWFAFAGNLGILVGPLIGGLLANPVEQYPSLFVNVQFLVDYPYVLPTLVVAVLGLSAVVVTVLFVDETLVRDPLPGSAGAGESAIVKPPRLSTWEVLKSPGVPIVIFAYGHVMLLGFSYTAVVPLFWFTPTNLGGFGFSYLQISLFLALTGLAQAIWLVLIFPPLQHRFGTNRVILACAIAWPVEFAAMPFCSMLLRSANPAGTATFWAVAPLVLIIGAGVSMAFTGVQLALNDVSPSPVVLGTLNALALSVVSGVRAFCPALFTTLFAIGARTQWLWGYAIWVLMTLMAVLFAVVCWYLPDYNELKKQRERQRVG
ncbi:major facilitator superfamily domain-containing protein [Lasiosphaeria miniovina]|uniref:Major facilitator superfamily domain-containing protein n=1 Tax=Lasiosphaeria miniovina TaxID=1954250 RepID=A0AA40ED58_9PEZI|nr:major facilitator superfamily domain-containing protein [Lasiosphaeria miniovina]KAK0733987.1 major facilitator superfamily domain-containing protein [Lasiosphaeria miniovina]